MKTSEEFNTPILFLIFNRPDTTQLVFDEIRKVKPKQLFIASDGPRQGNKQDKISCNKVRKIVSNIDWDCEVKTLFREENLGCGKAVSSAITWFFQNVEEGIILEDDCLPAQSFFLFCQELLQKYRYDTRIMCISGDNSFNIPSKDSYYFSNIPLIWGWASWKRAWDLYDFNMSNLNNFESSYSRTFYSKNLLDNFRRTKTGEIDTWDYQWAFCNIINNGLTCISSKNLISNIGFGENATHTKVISSSANYPINNEIKDISHPIIIYPNILFKDTYLTPFKLIKNKFKLILKKFRK